MVISSSCLQQGPLCCSVWMLSLSAGVAKGHLHPSPAFPSGFLSNGDYCAFGWRSRWENRLIRKRGELELIRVFGNPWEFILNLVASLSKYQTPTFPFQIPKNSSVFPALSCPKWWCHHIWFSLTPDKAEGTTARDQSHGDLLAEVMIPNYHSRLLQGKSWRWGSQSCKSSEWDRVCKGKCWHVSHISDSSLKRLLREPQLQQEVWWLTLEIYTPFLLLLSTAELWAKLATGADTGCKGKFRGCVQKTCKAGDWMFEWIHLL